VGGPAVARAVPGLGAASRAPAGARLGLRTLEARGLRRARAPLADGEKLGARGHALPRAVRAGELLRCVPRLADAARRAPPRWRRARAQQRGSGRSGDAPGAIALGAALECG